MYNTEQVTLHTSLATRTSVGGLENATTASCMQESCDEGGGGSSVWMDKRSATRWTFWVRDWINPFLVTVMKPRKVFSLLFFIIIAILLKHGPQMSFQVESLGLI